MAKQRLASNRLVAMQFRSLLAFTALFSLAMSSPAPTQQTPFLPATGPDSIVAG